MKLHNYLTGILLLVLSVTGCAYMSGSSQPNPELSAQYLVNAQELEKRGDLPAAMEKYKLALTADPGNSAAAEGQKQLSKRTTKIANDHYQLGLRYYNRGKYALARNEFLTALKYQQDHQGALKMVMSRESENAPGYIFHVVKPGESLSAIAQKYYGDFKKFNVIAEFNSIEDVTMVKPGQRIMVPEINGQKIVGVSATSDDTSTYVIHKLQPGESIAKLAKTTYGDYRKFHIIAQFNDMADATKVTVGQPIKLPRVAGMPFHPPSTEAEPALIKAVGQQTNLPRMSGIPIHPPSAEAEPALVKETPEYAEMPEPETQPTDELEVVEEPQPVDEKELFAYRDSGIELFNQGKYEEAVFELNKAMEATPEDQKTRTYMAKAYFENGKELFAQEDFKAAEEAFESALNYDPECNQCQAMIDKSKLGPSLQHRTKGLAYFNKGQFDQAIAEFEQFLQIQPQDGEARLYLSKSYYQLALEDFNKRNFQEAKDGFEVALKTDENCERCAEYISLSMDGLKESHYNRGIVFFSKEQLPEAIKEWQMVYDIEPDYKDVDQDLKKAKSLLEKLERIKNSSK